tara:strand:+ start:43983 stop:44321 length:339 start_codon:yes stop_codon:yes gene_type:complete
VLENITIGTWNNKKNSALRKRKEMNRGIIIPHSKNMFRLCVSGIQYFPWFFTEKRYHERKTNDVSGRANKGRKYQGSTPHRYPKMTALTYTMGSTLTGPHQLTSIIPIAVGR